MSLVDQIKKMDGQISDCEVEHLYALASSLPPKSLIVEIGCFRGKSTASIAAGMPADAKMVCIDPWMKQAAMIRDTTKDYHTAETLLIWRQNTEPWKDQITQIVGYPLEVAQWWDAEIDMLFIDCCKVYEQIAPIWRAWFPWCRNVVASHDYNLDSTHQYHYPGVIKALEEIVFPNCVVPQHVHFTWTGRVKR